MATQIVPISAAVTVVQPEVLEKARALALQVVIDPAKPETVTAIGASAQQTAAAVSEQLLAHVRVKDAGDAGSLLGQLALKCKAVDPKHLKEGWRGTLSHVPLLGAMVAHSAAVFEGYSGLLKEVEGIAAKLETTHSTLLGDNRSLTTLYDSNLATFQQLQIWIEVCRIKRDEMDETLIPQAKQKVGQDPLAAQRLADIEATRERLDKHMHDLELTAAVRLQNAPKIRIIQSGNSQLADKLQSSVLNTIPLWKDNLALIITQQRQKEAANLEDQVDDTTNALLRSSADMLHEGAVQIAKQGNRGVVDVDTLKFTQDKLLATITETQEIAANGTKEREAARLQLTAMQEELKQKLAKA